MGQEVSQISCKFKRMYSGQGVVLCLMFDRDENTWLNFFIICKEIHIQISLSFIFIVFSCLFYLKIRLKMNNLFY